jgi:UDP-N-acetyl-D-glucosamine dehydrogenase
VLVLGLAYKKNVEDLRESPSVRLIALLTERGAEVDYSDPYVPSFPSIRNYRFDLESVRLTPEVLAGYDAVLLATDHDDFDYAMIARHARLVIDTRGRYPEPRDNVVRA